MDTTYHPLPSEPQHLENKFLLEIDGEEQGKALRFAIEMSKINEYLEGDFSPANLVKLKDYDISLALDSRSSLSIACFLARSCRFRSSSRFFRSVSLLCRSNSAVCL